MRLNNYLKEYLKFQEHIVLVYRPTEKSWWTDRCYYLEPEKFDSDKDYNHRSILDCEIVIEFDTDNKEENLRLVNEVMKRVKQDKIKCMLWESGNKSYHLHFLIDMKNARYPSTLKRAIIKYYTKGLGAEADLRLCKKHLIRAEYGVHEKTGQPKSLLMRSPKYMNKNIIKPEIWNYYNILVTTNLKRQASVGMGDLSKDHRIRFLLDEQTFGKYKDGHSRALYVLIHSLKSAYKDKNDLFKFLRDWYRYSGGFKLKDGQIRYQVNYHWDKDYNIIQELDDLYNELRGDEKNGSKKEETSK